ncbi:hypothetical protein [Burkholderia cenocepacia]|uniref:hypothetical protein n=1 Tax=Burkholderia cenocepacia TaxID=95486 RepID=UPI002ABD9CD2|nr:hypothetical protein [Burkholderia cenocepacia]
MNIMPSEVTQSRGVWVLAGTSAGTTALIEAIEYVAGQGGTLLEYRGQTVVVEDFRKQREIFERALSDARGRRDAKPQTVNWLYNQFAYEDLGYALGYLTTFLPCVAEELFAHYEIASLAHSPTVSAPLVKGFSSYVHWIGGEGGACPSRSNACCVRVDSLVSHITNYHESDANSRRVTSYGRRRVLPNRFQYPSLHAIYLDLETSIGIASHPPRPRDMTEPYLRGGQWANVGVNLARYSRAFQVDAPWSEFDLIAVHFRGNAALRAIAKGYMAEAVSSRDEEEDNCCGGAHALRQMALRRTSIARMFRSLRARRGEFNQMVAHWRQVGF